VRAVQASETLASFAGVTRGRTSSSSLCRTLCASALGWNRRPSRRPSGSMSGRLGRRRQERTEFNLQSRPLGLGISYEGLGEKEMVVVVEEEDAPSRWAQLDALCSWKDVMLRTGCAPTVHVVSISRIDPVSAPSLCLPATPICTIACIPTAIQPGDGERERCHRIIIAPCPRLSRDPCPLLSHARALFCCRPAAAAGNHPKSRHERALYRHSRIRPCIHLHPLHPSSDPTGSCPSPRSCHPATQREI